VYGVHCSRSKSLPPPLLTQCVATHFSHLLPSSFLLAKLHFGQAAARVPSAVSVVWMALTGSILAVIWRYIPIKPTEFDRTLVTKYPPFSMNTLKFWKKAE